MSLLSGCGSASSAPAAAAESLALSLSSPTVTLSAGTNGSVTVNVSRSNTTKSVTLSVSGLPTGSSVNYTQPVTGNSGGLALATTPATTVGTYTLTVSATDGVSTATIPLSLVVTVAVDAISLSLSSSTVTVPQGGSIGRVTVEVSRIASTGSVSLSVTGLPSGAAINYDQQPGTGNTGILALNPETAAQGSYALTISASDGVATTTISLSFVINAGTTSLLKSPITWSSTGPLISAVSDSTHTLIAVKDPSAFYYNNQWNIYATSVNSSGSYSMVYLSFSDWSKAAAAKPYYMDATSGFSGYHCAPEVFYFTPTKTWYMIFQSPQPQYSTTTDPTNPASWSKPQNFFSAQPASVSNWIDFFAVCDTANCYLFFSGDNGNFYSSQTTIGNFPQGFSEPVIAVQAASNKDLFESGKVYALQGLNQYLMIIEAGNSSWVRYYRAFIAPSLAGPFTPLPNGNSWSAPFAGKNDVTFNAGVGTWTNDISHGELLRVGYDETLTIDPANLQFLYMGDNPAANASSYTMIPWQLGLMTRSN